MFDTKKAAEYFVVAWVKDWPLWQYIQTVTETTTRPGAAAFTQMVNEVAAAYPWLPVNSGNVGQGVRQAVGAYYPKLSAWLFSHEGKPDILSCAASIERLTPASHRGYVSTADRKEMRDTSKAGHQATASYRISRDAYKTTRRSAWTTCKP